MIVADLAIAARRVLRTPVWSACAVLGLGAAMGVGTTLFSVYSAVVFRFSDRESPEHVRVSWIDKGGEFVGAILPPDVSATILSALPLESVLLAGYRTDTVAVLLGDHARIVRAERIAGPYFAVLGLAPVQGRLLGPADEHAPVVVVSERLLNASSIEPAAAMGRALPVAGELRTIVGVIGPSFGTMSTDFGGPDVWLPSSTDPPKHFIGRLRPSRTPAQATAELRSVTNAVMAGRDAELAIARGLMAVPWAAYIAGLGGLGFCVIVLGVAVGSMANLLLARLGGRQSEIAVRLMLGASTGDIRRLLAAEVLLIVIAAGVLALMLTPITSAALTALLPTRDAFVWNLDLRPDWRLVLYALAIGAGTAVTLVAGVAAHAGQAEVSEISGSSLSAPGFTSRTRTTRNRLVTAQVGGSAFLLVIAGLFVQQVGAELRPPAGLSARGAAVGWIDYPSQGIEPAEARRLEARLIETARQMPGIQSVALATALPGRRIKIFGVRSRAGSIRGRAYGTGVTEEFLSAAGLSLTMGRWLTRREVRSDAAVMVIDERGRELLFPNENPVGQRVTVTSFGEPAITVDVVGVVQDANVPTGLPSNQFFAYLPFARVPAARVAVIARGAGPVAETSQALRAAAARVSPELALVDLMPLREALGMGSAFVRLAATVLGAIGVVGVSIAFLGLYGLVSSVVGRREREFAIRRALGATGFEIGRMVGLEGIRLITTGLAGGVGAGAVLAILLQRRFWELPVLDWTTVAGVSVALLCLGLAASLLPLRSVHRHHLADVLRGD